MRYALVALCAVMFASSIAPAPAHAFWHDKYRIKMYHQAARACIAHAKAHHKKPHCAGT